MIQVTWFGWVFMPLLVVVVLWARPWLPGLVLGSAVFQAAAVVNLPVGAGHYGISPYVASATIAGLVMLWRRCGSDQSPIFPPAHIHIPAMWLFAYAALAVAGSFVLPHIFSGIPVQPPLDPNGYSLNDLPPLKWSISNLAQAINLCVHVVVAFFLWQAMRRQDWSTGKTLIAFSTAAAIAMLAGIHDGIALALNWPRMASFWMSNLGYAQVDHVLYHIPYITPTPDGSTFFVFYRISSPFSEPSYGSAFFAAIYTGGLAALLFSSPIKKFTLLITLFSAAALINTTGSTGWVAGFASTAILLAVWFFKNIRAYLIKKNSIPNISPRGLAITMVISIALIFSLSHPSISQTAPGLIKVFIINKSVALKNDGRILSDMRAIDLTKKTFGIGVGLGSNRSSSLFTSLLSNTGLSGTFAFFALIATLFFKLTHTHSTSNIRERYFAAAALMAIIFAASLSIPDLNLPFLWAFIFLAFILSPPEVPDTKNITAQP